MLFLSYSQNHVHQQINFLSELLRQKIGLSQTLIQRKEGVLQQALHNFSTKKKNIMSKQEVLFHNFSI